jgi:hypothetical protein
MVFGAHEKGAAVLVHVVCSPEKHTMPSAQSSSALHGPGTHSLMSDGAQSGGGGQSVPTGHATRAQLPSPTTWHAKPLAQSASVAQELPACAWHVKNTVASTAAQKVIGERKVVMGQVTLEGLEEALEQGRAFDVPDVTRQPSPVPPWL